MGRLGQVIDGWLDTVYRCLGLDLGEQRRGGLGCANAICQLAYGRNLIVESRP